MTYREICGQLKDAGIDNSDLEAALLIERFCGEEHAAFEEFDYKNQELETALKKRCEHVPLQYLLGKWGFYRQSYFVSPDCLIPRSDTEILVEEAIKVLPNGARFVDLCTGSGCLLLALMHYKNGCRGIGACR